MYVLCTSADCKLYLKLFSRHTRGTHQPQGRRRSRHQGAHPVIGKQQCRFVGLTPCLPHNRQRLWTDKHPVNQQQLGMNQHSSNRQQL